MDSRIDLSKTLTDKTTDSSLSSIEIRGAGYMRTHASQPPICFLPLQSRYASSPVSTAQWEWEPSLGQIS